MRIVIIFCFLIVVGLVFLALQVPTLDQEKVEAAIKDVIVEFQVTMEDEDTVRQAVTQSIGNLEMAQRKRLKYLVSAYLVIWLIFMLYIIRVAQQQNKLDQRLSQLEQDTPAGQEDE